MPLALSLFLCFEGIWGAPVGEVRQALMAQVIRVVTWKPRRLWEPRYVRGESILEGVTSELTWNILGAWRTAHVTDTGAWLLLTEREIHVRKKERSQGMLRLISWVDSS